MAELKDKRYEQLCLEYLVDLNQTQAAIRTGYSPRTANTQAARLFAKVSIRARVAELMAERSRRTGVNADRVVRELARLAFASAPDFIDPATAEILDSASSDDKAAVQSIRVKRGDDFTEREVKLCDKVKALELLGKHMGMFTDNIRMAVDRPTIIDDIPDGGGNG